MTANLRRVKCRRKRSRRNEIAFRTTGEQTLEKNRKMEWAVILLIFCGLAAMVLMVARVNLPVAMGLMVVLNWAVTIRFKNYQRRLEGLLMDSLYGPDRAWIADGHLCGVPAPEYTEKPDYGFSNQRGLHWPVMPPIAR